MNLRTDKILFPLGFYNLYLGRRYYDFILERFLEGATDSKALVSEAADYYGKDRALVYSAMRTLQKRAYRKRPEVYQKLIPDGMGSLYDLLDAMRLAL